MNIYTIYDDVAKESGQLFPAKNDGVATRYVETLFVKDNVLPSIKDHLRLYCVGTYDEETMVFTPNKHEVLPTNEGDEIL